MGENITRQSLPCEQRLRTFSRTFSRTFGLFARQLIRQSRDPKVSSITLHLCASAKSFAPGRTPTQAEGIASPETQGQSVGSVKAPAKEPVPSPVLEYQVPSRPRSLFSFQTQHVSLTGPKFLKKKLKQNLNCNLTTSNNNKKQVYNLNSLKKKLVKAGRYDLVTLITTIFFSAIHICTYMDFI